MRTLRSSMVVMMALWVGGSATAGIFSRKPKVDPAEAVPSLIMQLKTDKDEGKRATAAEELRNFDAKSFPEIVTVLADALLKDPSIAVRADAAGSIAKLRPISQPAGFALETASSNDPSLRVKMAAKQALLQYHLVGYRSGKPADATAKAGPTLPPPTVVAGKAGPHTSAKNPKINGRDSAEPPLADGPSTSNKPTTPQPSAPPKLLTPPKSGEPEGPSLGPN